MFCLFSNRILIAVAIFGSAFLLSSLSFAVTDEPDLEKEKRLHQIYKHYNESPTREESWAGAVNGKTQTYSIQQGDTLWDLSNALFGDSQFWPKVWSINSDKIENPHEIFPGLTVHFTPGTTGEAPSLAVKPSEEKPLASLKSEVAEPAPLSPAEANFQKDTMSRVELPPEAPAVNPTSIPGSLPRWTLGNGAAKKDLIFELKKVNTNFKSPEQPLLYFVSDQPVQGIGVLSETELSQTTASDFQYVYVKLSASSPEKTVYAVTDAGEMKDPFTGTKGRLVHVQGELEILEKVNAEENLYRAMVKKTVSPIEVGSIIVAGAMPHYNAQEQGTSSGSAHIVGGPKDIAREMYESQSLIFLSGDGLVEGQTYPIFKNQPARIEKTKVIENPRQIGRVKVLKRSNNFATGVVLQASEEIQVGDVTNPHMIK
jgi:hypothetical protein